MSARTGAILVVDRDAESCALPTVILSEQGYDVRVVHHWPAVLAAVAVEPPDLVLLDAPMPGTDASRSAGTAATSR